MRGMLQVVVAMTRTATVVVVEGLFVLSGLIATGPVSAATVEDRATSSVQAASQPIEARDGDSSKSDVPDNIVTSKEPEPKSKTDKALPKKETVHRNPDYDASGNIVLDLGAGINDMEVVENNLVVVSPTAARGKMFFIHIEPGAGLKGVKVTDTFGWVPEVSDRVSRRMLRPCVVVFDKKRFGDPEANPKKGDNQKAAEDGYLRVVTHCDAGGMTTTDGSLQQGLDVVEGPNPDSSEGANPNISNPTVRIPVSISKKDGRLVTYPDRIDILSAVSPENTGLFKNKTITAAGVMGLKRSVKIGKVKVEVDKDKNTCLVISDPDAPPPQ